MAFASFTCIDDVVKKYKLHHVPAPLLLPDLTAPLFDAHFRGELAFNFRKLPIGRSEIGSGEILLFPILREVWKPYADELALFSHEGLTYDYDLTGIPDFVCKISEYGQTIPDNPVPAGGAGETGRLREGVEAVRRHVRRAEAEHGPGRARVWRRHQR